MMSRHFVLLDGYTYCCIYLKFYCYTHFNRTIFVSLCPKYLVDVPKVREVLGRRGR